MDGTTFLKVYFPNGSFHALRYTPTTTAAELIRVVLKGRLSPYELFYHLSFALRVTHVSNEQLNHVPAVGKSHIVNKWLHPNVTMEKVQDLYGPATDLRFELRLRYFPQSLDAFAHDKATFGFFYEQLRIDYMRSKSEHVSTNDAIELGSLEIRKLFKDLNSSALDKKVNMDYLEKELGLRKFFPQSLLDSQKPRALRKHIKACLKKYEGLAEDECVKRFCCLLKDVWNWEQELFTCNLGAEWAIPINLVLGPSDGISYSTHNTARLTKMTPFETVLSITTSKVASSDRGLIKLGVAGSSEVLTLSFPSLSDAHDVAILIDGYCMLVSSNTNSLWRSAIDEQASHASRISPSSTFLTSHSSDMTYSQYRTNDDDDDDDSNDDYADVLSPEYQIERKQIQMIDSLGNGQFGEVYRGILKTDQQLEINIAIKTCKMQDTATTDAFLDEAYVMQKFNHPHIIKLIGVCSEQPVLLIMELARLGELRAYLVANRADFDVLTLLLYCKQLASALAYLESRKFVHRDIAARNVLVSNHESVKLADFGLSRQLALDNSYYKASKGKLPIKWMAPESINFRRFTHLSDVWMFAVCMWEILTMGRKPFQGIANVDVIDQIENGVRLVSPGAHCPQRLYDLLQECWAYEPTARPHFAQIDARLTTIWNDERTNTQLKAQKICAEPEEKVPPKPALPSKGGFTGSRVQINNNRIATGRSESSHQLHFRAVMGQKFSSSPSTASLDNKDSPERNARLSKPKDPQAASSALTAASSPSLTDLFHSQTKQIVNAVLALTRQNDLGHSTGPLTAHTRPLSPLNDREQMQLVKNIAIAVRDLLQTLDYAPASIKTMSEQRYNHFSGLVVSLIEAVRQRNYEQVNEHAMNIARTAKALFDDILKLS